MNTGSDTSWPVTGNKHVDDALLLAVSSMQPGWIVVQDYALGVGDVGSRARTRYAMLHSRVGIALLDIVPGTPTRCAADRVRRSLDAAGFQVRFGAYPPVVHLCMPSHALPDVKWLLTREFALLPSLTMHGGDAWVPAAQQVLSPSRSPPRELRQGSADSPSTWKQVKAHPTRHRTRGMGGLAVFWSVSALTIGGGALVLQYLGPPDELGAVAQPPSVAREAGSFQAASLAWLAHTPTAHPDEARSPFTDSSPTPGRAEQPPGQAVTGTARLAVVTSDANAFGSGEPRSTMDHTALMAPVVTDALGGPPRLADRETVYFSSIDDVSVAIASAISSLENVDGAPSHGPSGGAMWTATRRGNGTASAADGIEPSFAPGVIVSPAKVAAPDRLAEATGFPPRGTVGLIAGTAPMLRGTAGPPSPPVAREAMLEPAPAYPGVTVSPPDDGRSTGPGVASAVAEAIGDPDGTRDQRNRLLETPRNAWLGPHSPVAGAAVGNTIEEDGSVAATASGSRASAGTGGSIRWEPPVASPTAASTSLATPLDGATLPYVPQATATGLGAPEPASRPDVGVSNSARTPAATGGSAGAEVPVAMPSSAVEQTGISLEAAAAPDDASPPATRVVIEANNTVPAVADEMAPARATGLELVLPSQPGNSSPTPAVAPAHSDGLGTTSTAGNRAAGQASPQAVQMQREQFGPDVHLRAAGREPPAASGTTSLDVQFRASGMSITEDDLLHLHAPPAAPQAIGSPLGPGPVEGQRSAAALDRQDTTSAVEAPTVGTTSPDRAAAVPAAGSLTPHRIIVAVPVAVPANGTVIGAGQTPRTANGASVLPPRMDSLAPPPHATPHRAASDPRVEPTVPGVARTITAASATAQAQCRAVLLKAQLGEDISQAERSFLRRGCDARRDVTSTNRPAGGNVEATLPAVSVPGQHERVPVLDTTGSALAVGIQRGLPVTSSSSSGLVEALIARGDAMIARRDVSAARLLYERAAAESASAAVALARTYDPAFLAEIGAQGIRSDMALATAWYRKAVALADSQTIAKP